MRIFQFPTTVIEIRAIGRGRFEARHAGRVLIPSSTEPLLAAARRLLAEGWGAALGFPGIVLDEHGEPVRGLVFSSDELAAHWERLDAFEGEGYERVPTVARREDGSQVDAYIYRLRELPA